MTDDSENVEGKVASVSQLSDCATWRSVQLVSPPEGTAGSQNAWDSKAVTRTAFEKLTARNLSSARTPQTCMRLSTDRGIWPCHLRLVAVYQLRGSGLYS